MRLTPMRFKDFTWPHNPEVYTVEHRRRIAVHQVPFGQCVMQELGGSYRVLKGEGVFVGEDAYEQFRRLVQVFREDGPGLLVHPVWQTERAYFAALEMTEEPLPDFVRYRFEFWEDCGGQNGKTHAVRKGDTLWGIARQYSVGLEALLKVNPQIKNPNLIHPGEAVRIP